MAALYFDFSGYNLTCLTERLHVEPVSSDPPCSRAYLYPRLVVIAGYAQFFHSYLNQINYLSIVELQMRRPQKERYRLDKLLERKAKEGVKIYVIL